MSVGVGLLVSASVRSEDQATSFIPLVLIPQLLFAGAIVPVAAMVQPIKAISKLVYSQWAFAGTGNAIDMNQRIGANPRFAAGEPVRARLLRHLAPSRHTGS